MSYADTFRQRHLEKDWRDSIQKGDVLASPSGLRVVRRVSYNGEFLGCVFLAIMRCSWTRRPYTVVNRCDLSNRAFVPTGVKATLKGKLDKRLEREIGAVEDNRKLFCWDTVGVVS